MHILILETGLFSDLLPPGVTEFVIIADSSNLGVKQISLGLMQVRLSRVHRPCLCSLTHVHVLSR